MLRMLLFLITLVLTTSVGGLGCIVVGIFNRFSPISYNGIVVPWARLLLKVAGVQVVLQGEENLDSGASFIFLSNHMSHMDIPVLIATIPARLTIIAKKELFRIPLFGQAMHAIGVLKIDRSKRQKAIKTLNKAAEILRREKLSLLAFPEGTRSKDGKIHSFKKGPFVLATNVKVPILPVTIVGTHPILPKGEFFIQPGTVEVIIHPPVDTADYDYEQREQLMEHVYQTITESYYANHQEVPAINRA